MDLHLNSGQFKPQAVNKTDTGIGYSFKFNNNYGASVIKTKGAYGYEQDLWELAVIYYDENGKGELTYNTPITDNVLGYLTDEKVVEVLDKISSLRL